MNYYQNYNPTYNPYFNQPRVQSVPQQIPMEQQINQQQAQPYVQQPIKPIGLLGKSVDSIDVVKAMDIPLDGSISYFPLTDGSAIVTKQLQADGTSKTIVYKPVEEEKKETPNYITAEEVDKKIKNIDLSELDEMKEEFKEIRKELKEIKSKIKSKED